MATKSISPAIASMFTRGQVPVGKPAAPEGYNILADVQSQTAKGQILAEQFVSTVQSQSAALLQAMREVYYLNTDGRNAFRKQLQAWRTEANKHAKTLKDADGARRLVATTFSRISEAMTCCKAMEKGWTLTYRHAKPSTFAQAVSGAREFLDAAREQDAKNGAKTTGRRGRVAKSSLQKAEEYIARMVEAGDLKKAQLSRLADFIRSGAKMPEAPATK